MLDHQYQHMTTQPAPSDSPTSRRFACLQIGNGDYVIYDQQNPNTWIQSDTTYPLSGTTDHVHED